MLYSIGFREYVVVKDGVIGSGDTAPDHRKAMSVVETSGFEPLTLCLQSRCSTS